MTVAELKNQLSKLPADAKVVVHCEEGELRMGADGLFEIDEVSLQSGTPSRGSEKGEAGFKFEKSGPASWAFITVSPA
ncbi:MAG TPA: hypothetical protein VK805_19510 [Candidatus Baltobacteraceae bacterium]|nr:hypothetical protein [Candidatus Baltobacteraceae bacterium]